MKSYQRRAMARIGLGQLQEARADLLKVMELEPKNMASKAELMKLEKKINIKPQQKVILSYYSWYLCHENTDLMILTSFKKYSLNKYPV